MQVYTEDDLRFMQMAIQEAQLAFAEAEIPVGAIIVQQRKVIGRGYNQTERLKDVTAHAEIIALSAAANGLGAKYLPDATLYVTLEPCHMCAGALYWSKIGRIVIGAADVKHGFKHFYGTKYPFHPKTTLTEGVLAEECAALMKNFFTSKRQ